MGIDAIVASIIAAFFYDTGKAVVKSLHTCSQEEELRKALVQYLEKQMMRYGEDGIAIIEEIPSPVRAGHLYHNVITAGANRDELLKQWMKGCQSENYDEVRATCLGCIDIIIAHVKYWPEFLPDMAISTKNDMSEIHKDTKETLRIISGLKHETTQIQNPTSKISRAAEYADKWSEPLFLNNPSKNRNVIPVCPKDIYVPHRYIFGDEPNPSDEMEYPLLDELAKCGGHLVMGDPGIGKSTLISWYLNNSCDKRTRLVYRLTDFDLTGKEMQPGVFLLERMGLRSVQMTDTILFLDGLDECGLTPENRVRFLQELHSNWQFLKEKNNSWVVTCRMNYITGEQLHRIKIPCITLLPLENKQIEQFLQKFETILGQSIPDKKRAALLSKRNTGKHGSPFGIPLILYMATASDITVTENSTLVDVYDQLFPALYQRSSSYDTYEQETVYRLHEEIHQMSRDIALWMLLYSRKTASIPKEAYETVEKAFGSDIAKEHAHQIGSYFRSMHHTEGETELCFIHRTMYEYFVADGFVHRAIQAKTPEDLSRVISWYWYAGQMEDTMQRYVYEKLRKSKKSLNYPLWESAGLRILEKGVYRCWPRIADEPNDKNACSVALCLLPENGESVEDDRRIENSTFWNLCHILFWVWKTSGGTDHIFKSKRPTKALSRAIRHCSADYLPIYCPAFSLPHASLSRAVLSHAVLSGADLSYAHLSVADLTGADLVNANLKGANLNEANLTGALLSEKQVRSLGYKKLFDCHFDNILVGSSFDNSTEYPRKRFFATFFKKTH